MSEFGAEIAFNRTLPFSELEVLQEIVPYFKKSLNLIDAEIILVEDARAKGYATVMLEGAEPGSPAFEYYNV
jgi:leucyl-tRNA synthetase